MCNAPVWYERKKRWYLTEEHYYPTREEESTWRANIYSGKSKVEREPQHIVAKYFELEKGENLFASPGKYRPVILIRKYQNDWLNPANTSEHIATWLCLPLFSYKDRHNQPFVLNDMAFKSPERVYIPPSYKDKPGGIIESSAQFLSIQMIKEEYLEPLTSMSGIRPPKMQRPFRVSNFALKIIMFHFLKHFNLFDVLLDSCDTDGKTAYTLFVEEVNEILSKC